MSIRDMVTDFRRDNIGTASRIGLPVTNTTPGKQFAVMCRAVCQGFFLHHDILRAVFINGDFIINYQRATVNKAKCCDEYMRYGMTSAINIQRHMFTFYVPSVYLGKKSSCTK